VTSFSSDNVFGASDSKGNSGANTSGGGSNFVGDADIDAGIILGEPSPLGFDIGEEVCIADDLEILIVSINQVNRKMLNEEEDRCCKRDSLIKILNIAT
jgi:hypothetical protein